MTPSDLNWESFEDDSDAVVGAPPKKNKTAARKTEKAATSGGKASGKSAAKSTGQAKAEPEFEPGNPGTKTQDIHLSPIRTPTHGPGGQSKRSSSSQVELSMCAAHSAACSAVGSASTQMAV